MTGGTGNDVVAFEQTRDGPNTIADFNNTTDHNLIAVSASGFGSGLVVGMDVWPAFESSSDGTDANAIVLAHLPAGVPLSAHDLLIVICGVRASKKSWARRKATLANFALFRPGCLGRGFAA